jgi:hypothetical protein
LLAKLEVSLDESATVRDSKDRRMRNLKVILSYDGADFSGWQVQPDASTVQGTLALAIGRITGEKVLPGARAGPTRECMRSRR